MRERWRVERREWVRFKRLSTDRQTDRQPHKAKQSKHRPDIALPSFPPSFLLFHSAHHTHSLLSLCLPFRTKTTKKKKKKHTKGLPKKGDRERDPTWPDLTCTLSIGSHLPKGTRPPIHHSLNPSHPSICPSRQDYQQDKRTLTSFLSLNSAKENCPQRRHPFIHQYKTTSHGDPPPFRRVHRDVGGLADKL